MKSTWTRIDPVLVQETQELLGMISDQVSALALAAARGNEGAHETIKMVRDEIHSLVADVKESSADGKGI